MSYDAIRAAFETELDTFANGAGVPVAWEGVPYEPAAEGPQEFLVPDLLISEPGPASLGVNGQDRLQGVFQISVYVPKDGQRADAIRRGDDLVAIFGRGIHLTYGGVTVTCERAWPAKGLVSGSWYFVPVSVRWYTYN